MDPNKFELAVYKGEASTLGIEVDESFGQEVVVEAETKVNPSNCQDVLSTSFSAEALRKYNEERLPSYRTLL